MPNPTTEQFESVRTALADFNAAADALEALDLTRDESDAAAELAILKADTDKAAFDAQVDAFAVARSNLNATIEGLLTEPI